MVIIGGGLAGLSAGCYARNSGFKTTIVEHNITLGGVCTAWERGPYVIDGCIHWLTGGAFERLYEELAIVPTVALRPLERFATYRDARNGRELTISADLNATAGALREWAPEDSEEINRIVEGAERIVGLAPPFDAVELTTVGAQLAGLWQRRHELGTIAHFHKSMADWSLHHLHNPDLRRVFARLVPDEVPALFLLMMLGYLKRGYLSRPQGGTARFRDALIDTYRRRGGVARVHTTVDEILVAGDRAVGVRLDDGTVIDADVVVSTASGPETVLRLLGGRYGANATRQRIEEWKLLQPIVLASYGVAMPLAEVPSLLMVDRIEPFRVGGEPNDHLYIRVCNDGPGFAPPGHTVVQLMLPTDYDFWAKTGSRYNAEKDELGALALDRLDQHLPGVKAATRVTDIATPLTFWSVARSWRGAYEGWIPKNGSLFTHVKKTLPGLGNFFMAGQWVEPGGGVPTALLSGRQAVQLACTDEQLPFVAYSI